MAYDRIPSELRELHQWVVWKYVTIEGQDKPTKVPYCARTGRLASVTDANTWCSFDEAVRASSNCSGIGFVLTDSDEFCFCDLDQTDDPEYVALQKEIFERLDSYSEFSPGGKGLHIITRARVPHGRKQHSVELYSTRRFMTMTGNVYLGKPIQPRQDIIDIMYAQMSRGKDGKLVDFESQPRIRNNDQILIEGAAATHNGDKFKDLWHGKWQNYYQSQSEADFAFIDMLANYTDSKEQVYEMFMQCWLGQREKAKRASYVSTMINRAYDRRLKPIAFNSNLWQTNGNGSAFAGHPGLKVLSSQATEPSANGNAVTTLPIDDQTQLANSNGVNLPTGLIGECAQFIFNQSFHPNQEMALMAGILLIAGIAGRQYNVDGAGLNLFAVLIAETTMGKEAMASGMSKLIASARKLCPSIGSFVGPDEIASGPALLKHLEKEPCCFTTMAEFGLLLNSMYGDHVPPYLMTLRRTLLNVYAKSGRGNVMGKTIYSDKDKAINEIFEPAFSILGESTPSTFYKNLDDSLVAEGLAARLFIIEVRGDRSELNRNRQLVPALDLSTKLGALAAHCLDLRKTGFVQDAIWSEEARTLEKAFSAGVNRILNNRREELNSSLRDLWGRAPLTIMKLAALFAVSDNYLNPVISPYHWQQAQILVERAVLNIIHRFKVGAVGVAKPEDAQLSRMKIELKLIVENAVAVESYGLTQLMLDNGIISYGWFQKKLQHAPEFSIKKSFNTTFKDHGTAAIKRCLETLCDEGILALVDKNERAAKFNTQALMYRVLKKPE